jgi:hypothetical protein
LGYYFSACTTLPAAKDPMGDYYQQTKVHFEDIPSTWLLKNAKGEYIPWPKTTDRYFLDMRQEQVRNAVVAQAVSLAKQYGYDALSFDNCYWGLTPLADFPVSRVEWTEAFMNFYQEVGIAAKEANLKCIINVATSADKIADAFRAISPYVDGMMSEMAFHPNVRSTEYLERELAGYEDILKLGKSVYLIPRYAEDEQFALTAIQPLALRYRNIYVTARGTVHHEPLYILPQPDDQE